MVLVAGIVAVIAAMAAPRYANSLARYRAEAAARRVAADLQLARNRAMTANASQSVVFQSFRYQIPGLTAMNGAATSPYRVDLAGDPYRLNAVTADFGGDARVTFDAFGVPDSDGRVTLTCGGTSKTVLLNVRTGAAEVQ
jgi:type II secretory pathway pseudopilin PulG